MSRFQPKEFRLLTGEWRMKLAPPITVSYGPKSYLQAMAKAFKYGLANSMRANSNRFVTLMDCRSVSQFQLLTLKMLCSILSRL